MREERRLVVCTVSSLTLADSRGKREGMGAFNHTNEQGREGRTNEEMDERGGIKKGMAAAVVG